MDMARLIEARGSRLRDRPFLHWEPFEGSGWTWTYGEFARDAWRVAAGLRRLGVGPGSGVVLHLGNRPQAQLAWAACARLGAVAVRVDSRLTAAELTGLASRLGDVVVLTEPELADRSLTAFRHARGVLALAPDGTSAPPTGARPGRERPVSSWSGGCAGCPSSPSTSTIRRPPRRRSARTAPSAPATRSG
ncbi:AMP-binding protein [Streptomyces sp. NPDC002586]